MLKDFFPKKEFIRLISRGLNATLSIEISKLRLFGSHGMYVEESLVENEFEINVMLQYRPGGIITGIDQTINYVKAYEVIRLEFEKPTPLLETLAMRIAESLFIQFPHMILQEVHILKLHAPIQQFTGSVGVRYRKEY